MKQMEAKVERREEKIKTLLDSPSDPGVTFEESGIDYLIVDELHDYKNLETGSRINDAAIQGSKRSMDLLQKIEYLRDTHGGRVITGATATPIANSITGMYVMQRYLRPDLLADLKHPRLRQLGGDVRESHSGHGGVRGHAATICG